MAAILQARYSKAFSWMTFVRQIKVHWNICLRADGTEQATSHHLNRWWPSLLHICIIRPQWVDISDISICFVFLCITDYPTSGYAIMLFIVVFRVQIVKYWFRRIKPKIGPGIFVLIGWWQWRWGGAHCWSDDVGGGQKRWWWETVLTSLGNLSLN